eukprot:2239874-Rhodomonas_salina.4
MCQNATLTSCWFAGDGGEELLEPCATDTSLRTLLLTADPAVRCAAGHGVEPARALCAVCQDQARDQRL